MWTVEHWPDNSEREILGWKDGGATGPASPAPQLHAWPAKVKTLRPAKSAGSSSFGLPTPQRKGKDLGSRNSADYLHNDNRRSRHVRRCSHTPGRSCRAGGGIVFDALIALTWRAGKRKEKKGPWPMASIGRLPGLGRQHGWSHVLLCRPHGREPLLESTRPTPHRGRSSSSAGHILQPKSGRSLPEGVGSKPSTRCGLRARAHGMEYDRQGRRVTRRFAASSRLPYDTTETYP